MEIFIKLTVVACLLLIIYQDLRINAISWWPLPIIFFLSIHLALMKLKFSELLHYSIINFSFIVFQILILTVYFSIKKRKLTNIIDTYIGLGDILFFIILCISFSTINFILFFTFSTLIALIISVSIQKTRTKPFRKIPLVGLMGLIYLPLQVIAWTISDINLFCDVNAIIF